MKLGVKIREARLQKKLTQREVAGEHMTRNMLSKIENGSATPSVKTLEYIAGALAMPVSYFVSEDGGETGKSDIGQLTEIVTLAESLLAGELEPRAAALCVKARALMAQNETDAAAALLNGALDGVWEQSSLALFYKTLEDCYTRQGDYKQAYECLRKGVGSGRV